MRLIPDDRHGEENHILAKIRRGECVEHFETLRKTKDGRLINISVTASPIKDATGRVIGVSKVARDITERKQAEEARRRLDVLTASNRKLEAEIVRRQAVETSLKQREQHQIRLVEQSLQMQERLRQLSRQILSAQEEERKRISRELHDVIAQTLTGINVQLAAFAGVEALDSAKRTALFRVAQEALTNVSRHAQTSRVEISIQKLAAGIGMKIKDDGKSFSVEQRLQAKGSKRLGLLGMRERVEMVGGTFCVESAPGRGTTIAVLIPSGKSAQSRAETIRQSAPLARPRNAALRKKNSK